MLLCVFACHRKRVGTIILSGLHQSLKAGLTLSDGAPQQPKENLVASSDATRSKPPDSAEQTVIVVGDAHGFVRIFTLHQQKFSMNVIPPITEEPSRASSQQQLSVAAQQLADQELYCYHNPQDDREQRYQAPGSLSSVFEALDNAIVRLIPLRLGPPFGSEHKWGAKLTENWTKRYAAQRDVTRFVVSDTYSNEESLELEEKSHKFVRFVLLVYKHGVCRTVDLWTSKCLDQEVHPGFRFNIFSDFYFVPHQ